MSILRSVFQRFLKQIETNDQNTDDMMKTHYYKASFNQMFESVEKLFREDVDCRITTVSKEHGEIAVEVNKPIPCFLVATVVSVKPLETAVDFNISSERFIVSGTYPVLRKRLIAYYDKLKQIHTFIRAGKNN
jgi:adenylate cyclase